MSQNQISKLLKTAKSTAEKAIEVDKKSDKKTAIRLYLQAAETLTQIMEMGVDSKLYDECYEHAREYIKRAKQLKGIYKINLEPFNIKTEGFTELDIEKVLAEYPTLLTGIIYENYRVLGRQVTLSEGKRIDILAQDPMNKLAVIELKKTKPKKEDVDQILDYVKSIKERGRVDLSSSYILVDEVYGVLVAQEIDDSVMVYAIKNKVIPRQLDIKLLEKMLMTKRLIED
ncbi:endonuclease NucS domain-containing protein [Candidatus Borrarchaeum sp.]|uniref:endonuclease NucS domain-containing protein n=1 Tax=Candidatus Borrarchaeum sp. TaxID=2846742 RepID=UPI00257DF93C|nr:endonuclease NucS domain-containing protein [Candidatus Borrarchaeum sp.]